MRTTEHNLLICSDSWSSLSWTCSSTQYCK